MATYEEVKSLPNHPEKYLIDVRNADELDKTGKIPTSTNIPLPELETALKLSADEFKEKYSRAKPSNETIIIFSCQSGKRAAAATAKAHDLGFSNAKTYAGSWLEWAQKEGL